MVQIIAVEVEEGNRDEALELAIDSGNWQSSIDTEIDYLVLDESGAIVTE